jgi:putative endonuclease
LAKIKRRGRLRARLFAWIAQFLEAVPLGRQGERAAERHLKRRGYRMVARNFRAVGAEIDLMAMEGDTIVFVEVKTMSGIGGGEPADAVDRRKQERMRRAAEAFVARRRVPDREMRFDVVAITFDDRKMNLELIKDAF